MKPKLLDLFCGAGGAAMGLHRAGFDVTGVDNKPQPRYPFTFILADAMEVELEGYDCYWASPPCQWTIWAASKHRHSGTHYEEHVLSTRERLVATGKPYIIEQPMARPLDAPIRICGTAFGLSLIRHRWFEGGGVTLFGADCQGCRGAIAADRAVTVAGHGGNGSYRFERWCQAMGIDWMKREELTQAIPPAYSEYLGQWMMKALR